MKIIILFPEIPFQSTLSLIPRLSSLKNRPMLQNQRLVDEILTSHKDRKNGNNYTTSARHIASKKDASYNQGQDSDSFLTLIDRHAFLKLPMDLRRNLLEKQAKPDGRLLPTRF